MAVLTTVGQVADRAMELGIAAVGEPAEDDLVELRVCVRSGGWADLGEPVA
jgi:hypothetical protein